MSGRSGVAAEEDNHSDIFVGDRRPSDAGRFADAVTDGAMFVRVNSKCATIGRQQRLSGRPVNPRNNGESIGLDAGATNT